MGGERRRIIEPCGRKLGLEVVDMFVTSHDHKHQHQHAVCTRTAVDTDKIHTAVLLTTAVVPADLYLLALFRFPAACFKQRLSFHRGSMLWASSIGLILLVLLRPNKSAEPSCLCPWPAEHLRYRLDWRSIVSYRRSTHSIPNFLVV